MNTVIKALPLLAAGLGMLHTAVAPAGPVAINDYLGNWTSTAALYAAGSVVGYSSKTWLSLVDGNTKKPGAAGTTNQWRSPSTSRNLEHRYQKRFNQPHDRIVKVSRSHECLRAKLLDSTLDAENRMSGDAGRVTGVIPLP